MTRIYGAGPKQLHPFFEEKRTWSRVKDKIVGDYIDCYLKTVVHRGQPVTIVDAFAGPGYFGDGSDGSPLIICKAIERAVQRAGVGLTSIFADSHAPHRTALEHLIGPYIAKGIAARPLEDCSAALVHALRSNDGATLFFYLDPFGIKDLEFGTLREIYERDTRQSTEILLNFSFPTFMRMSGNWSYTDSASDVTRKVKQAKVDRVDQVMGGDYWRAILADQTLSMTEREDAVVLAYVDRIRSFFTHTYSIPVKQLQDDHAQLPHDQIAKYHLIFGTRSARAVRYMNDVAFNALTPYLDQFRDGLLFDVTPTRYAPSPAIEVKQAIVAAVANRPLTRPGVYETIVPQFFLQRPSKEYRAIIDELTFKDGLLFPNPLTLKKPGKLNDNTLLSTRAWPTRTR